MKIIYIVSSSFSGSTLLSFILNAHRQIGTISEFDNMEAIKKDSKFKCSCGEEVRKCGFFKTIKQKMEKNGFDFEIDDMDMMLRLHSNERINRYLTEKLPLLQSSGLEKTRDIIVSAIPSYRRKKNLMIKRNEAFFRTILELKDRPVFLDANKDPYRMLQLDSKHDVYAIYLYKNGIAGAYSFIKHNPGLAIEKASHRWFTEQISINRCLKSIDPKKQIHICWSNFCQDPPSYIKKICEQFNLEPFDMDKFMDHPHHILGNVMRLQKIVDIKDNEDWKRKLTEDEFRIYENVFEKYGKEIEKYNPEQLKNVWRYNKN